MQQQRLNHATTTTQQMQHEYACGTNRATTPFAKVIIRLVRRGWDLLAGQLKTLDVACWELLARRPRTLVG